MKINQNSKVYFISFLILLILSPSKSKLEESTENLSNLDSISNEIISIKKITFNNNCLPKDHAGFYAILTHTSTQTDPDISFPIELIESESQTIIANATCDLNSSTIKEGNFAFCSFPKSIELTDDAKYYVKSEGFNNSDNDTIEAFELNNSFIQFKNSEFNRIDNTEFISYTSYHGTDTEKNDTILLKFYNTITEIPNVKIITNEDDESTLSLECSVFEYNTKKLQCEIPGDLIEKDKDFTGKISTKCDDDITDPFFLKTKTMNNIMRITDIEIDRKCFSPNELIGDFIMNFTYQGEFSDDFDTEKCIKIIENSDSSNYKNVENCTKENSENLKCSSPYKMENDGNYNIQILENCLVKSDLYLLRPFNIKNIFTVNSNYSKPSKDEFILNVDYKNEEDQYEFNIEFNENLNGELPEIIFNDEANADIKLNCALNTTIYSILKCEINKKDFSAPETGYKIYKGKIINVCGYEESTILKLNVTDTTIKELPKMTFENLTFSGECFIGEKITANLSFYLDYKVEYLGNILDFNMNLINTDNETNELSVKCTAEKIKEKSGTFICKVISYLESKIEDGNYKPKLKSDLQYENYTIPSFYFNQTIKISTKSTPSPISPIENDTLIFDIVYGNSNSKNIEITFAVDLSSTNYLIPSIEINSKLLTCTISDTNTKILICPINKSEFPESTYKGTLKDYCGNDYYDILLTTRNSILVTFSSPKLSDGSYKECTKFSEGITISFELTNQEKLTSTYKLNNIQLISDDSSKVITTICTISKDEFTCSPGENPKQKQKYYISLLKDFTFENGELLMKATSLSEDDAITINPVAVKILDLSSMLSEYDFLTYTINVDLTFDSDPGTSYYFFAKYKGKFVGKLNAIRYQQNVRKLILDSGVLVTEDDNDEMYDIYLYNSPCNRSTFLKTITVRNTGGSPIVVFNKTTFEVEDGENSCTNFPKGSKFNMSAFNGHYLSNYAGYKSMSTKTPGTSLRYINGSCEGSDEKKLICYTTTEETEDGTYSYYPYSEQELYQKTIRIHVYTSNEFINVNKRYTKIKSNEVTISNDYSLNLMGKFYIEFDTNLIYENACSVYANNYQLDCMNNEENDNKIVCYFNEKQLPPGKEYKATVKNACGKDEKVDIKITPLKTGASREQSQIILKDPNFYNTKRCNTYKKGYKFSVDYTISSASLSSDVTEYQLKNPKLYSVDKVSYNININCQNDKKNNIFNCQTIDDTLGDNHVGKYIFKVDEYENDTLKYIIYGKKSTNTDTFTINYYYEPVTKKIEIEHNTIDTKKGSFKIEYKEEIYTVPLVTVNEKHLNCSEDGKYIICDYSYKSLKYDDPEEEVESEEEEEEITFSGFVYDACGNEEIPVSITFYYEDTAKKRKNLIVGLVSAIAAIVVVIIVAFIFFKCRHKYSPLNEEIMHISAMDVKELD